MESINILQLQETESELMAYVNNKIKHENQKEEEIQVNKLLQQKEKDLVLAAELGKALLEKNEDLSQQNEKMAEDFAKQLEVRTNYIRKLALKTALHIFIKKKWVVWHQKKGFSWFSNSQVMI